MSADTDHTNPDRNIADGAATLGAVDTLHYIEDMLLQLRELAGSLNELPLNYFLEMANLEAKERLDLAISQQSWPAETPTENDPSAPEA